MQRRECCKKIANRCVRKVFDRISYRLGATVALLYNYGVSGDMTCRYCTKEN
jgi:hypothetical protein